MHTITITLSNDRLAKLQEIAARFHISPEKAFTLQPAGNEPRVEADVSPDPARKKPNATLTATAFRQEPECDPFYEGSVQTPVDDPARRWQLFERDRHSFGKATR